MSTRVSAHIKRLRTPVDFDALSPAEGRVEIAKDVLAGLETGRLEALQNVYWNNQSGTSDGPLREQLVDRTCQVCAIGALFIAEVARNNKFDFHFRVDRSEMFDKLSRWFSEDQLTEIECAFECRACRFCNLVRAIEFGKKYADPTARMRAIMENIIANKGDFKPEGATT